MNVELADLTGHVVTTGRQYAKLLRWLQGQGYPCDDLQEATVNEYVDYHEITELGQKVLRLRQKLSLGSLAKFDVIARAADSDERVRGLFQLYGGSQTGRWAGRLVQFQNLPRMSLSEDAIEGTITMFRHDDLETIKMLYSSDIFAAAKQLLRPMFIGDPGLIVSDLAQIESRVVSWLAGCDDLLHLFADSQRDPYSEMASRIYHRPASEFGKGTEGRQLGKAALLGLGFGMGSNKFVETAKHMAGVVIDEDQSKQIVDTYRGSFTEIPNFWYKLEAAVKDICSGNLQMEQVGHVTVHKWHDDVAIQLPSGRTLHYRKMFVAKTEDQKLQLEFEPPNANAVPYTYGGKLVENVTQAVARDVLANAMLRMESTGLPIVAHVHDEVIVENENPREVDTVNQIMSTNPEWAGGLPLAAETAMCQRYVK